MSAVHALKSARAAGVRIGIDGDALTLEAAAVPPPAVLEFLALHKAQVIALLRPGRDGWSGEDWQAFFDERAGIAEFDGGLPRDQAEARAFARCVAEWLNRNPVRSPLRSLPWLRRSRARPRPAASLRHRPDRPCLVAFTVLASLARRPEGGSCRRSCYL